MTGLAISIITRLGGMVGLKLTEFWAGALLAAGIVAAVGLYSVKLYDAGYASADAKCEAAALQSKIDAMEKDRDEARSAAAAASLKLAAIEAQSAVEQKRTEDYVEELKARPAPACGLTCDDLRGMRINSKACPAGARSPATKRKAVLPGVRAAAEPR